MKPFSEACERNREPILAVLKRLFADRRRVLEIGSGTGQHAAYFGPELPRLRWHASDAAENLCGIRAWGVEPFALDVDKPWPAIEADAAFSANTAHIMSWPQVERMARRCDFALVEDNAMPANNRLLAWRSSTT